MRQLWQNEPHPPLPSYRVRRLCLSTGSGSGLPGKCEDIVEKTLHSIDGVCHQKHRFFQGREEILIYYGIPDRLTVVLIHTQVQIHTH